MITNQILGAPYIDGLKRFMCAKYARLASEELSGAKYNSGHAWEMGERNIIVEELDGNIKRLEDYKDILIPGENIIVFYNKRSFFNSKDRIGTHTGLFLGINDNDEIIIAEQNGLKQWTRTYEKMKSKGISARQILLPIKSVIIN